MRNRKVVRADRRHLAHGHHPALLVPELGAALLGAIARVRPRLPRHGNGLHYENTGMLHAPCPLSKSALLFSNSERFLLASQPYPLHSSASFSFKIFNWAFCVFFTQVFQSDPFVYLEQELSEGSTTDLWLSGEHMPYKKIKNCVFNTGWIRDCYGKVGDLSRALGF
jgi:hypothetical protein